MSKRMRGKNEYGDWICGDCGKKYGRIIDGHICTMHIGRCDWCKRRRVSVTQPRDFGYPPMPLRNK